MRSIRLSLVLCFLVLLALALGTVSWFVYRTTKQSLTDKERAARELLQQQYTSLCKTEHELLDTHILQRAQTLARMAQTQWGFGSPVPLQVSGIAGVANTPLGALALPAWLEAAERRRRLPHITIDFAEDVLEEDWDGVDREYFQTSDFFGRPLQRSTSMGKFAFALDGRHMHEQLALFESHFDDSEVNGKQVRRVTLKAPVSKFTFNPGPPPQRGRRGNGRPNPNARRPQPNGDEEQDERPGPPRGRGPMSRGSTPIIFILCASETGERDLALAGFKQKLDGDLSQLESASLATLADVRTKLWTIALGTFAVAAIGGFWLVRLGLSPLERLSEAVGAISERDFRLPLKGDEEKLPRELRPIVDRLQQTLAMLERAFARERQAAADISHELRTPLAALLASTELGLRKTRTPNEYRQILENCHLSSQQMSRLVERLLALARLDAGVDTYCPREIDAAEIVRECASLVKPLAESRGLDLRVNCLETAPLHSDPDKLREIVSNLLSNAVEYNVPEGSVDLALKRHNGTLEIDVHDTGVGISPEACARIFDRFYRADPSRASDGLHAGLGLAIVKGYLDIMGGSISVDSSPQQGTTFHVKLPVRDKD
ncbi:MAG: sensor histidine kinase [Gemmataceae bacterium]